MEKIHHKSLKVIYQSDASYNDLLQLSNSVSLHQQDLLFLLTINENIQKFLYLEPPVHVVILQIQKGSI